MLAEGGASPAGCEATDRPGSGREQRLHDDANVIAPHSHAPSPRARRVCSSSSPSSLGVARRRCAGRARRRTVRRDRQQKALQQRIRDQKDALATCVAPRSTCATRSTRPPTSSTTSTPTRPSSASGSTRRPRRSPRSRPLRRAGRRARAPRLDAGHPRGRAGPGEGRPRAAEAPARPARRATPTSSSSTSLLEQVLTPTR